MPATIHFSLRFYDSQDFELDRWPVPSPRTVDPSQTANDTGNFTLENIRTIDAANRISRMAVWASFDLHYPDLLIEVSAPSDAVVGQPYDATFEASGGDGTYIWAVTSGQFPDGLTLSSNGKLSGTPTSAGHSFLRVEVTSGDGQVEGEWVTIDVDEVLEILTVSVLHTGTVGRYYSAVFLAKAGGGSDYSWQITAGALPDGLQLKSNSYISGTPTEAGTFNFTLTLRSGGQTATKDFSVTIH